MGRPSVASTADLHAQEAQASSWYKWRPTQREERVRGLLDLLLFLQIQAGRSPPSEQGWPHVLVFCA